MVVGREESPEAWVGLYKPASFLHESEGVGEAQALIAHQEGYANRGAAAYPSRAND